jgi:4-hydroxy-tetrahydrodipicolinate reductase
MIRVAVAGSRGRVGQALVPMLAAAEDVEYVGGVGSDGDLAALLAEQRPHVLVDFTHPDAALGNALAAVEAGAVPVVGTSGLSGESVDRLEAACAGAGLGGIVAPNFAVGAAVMMWLAEKAAPFFDAAEVIEMHHAGKADAPSGTAMATARRLAEAGSFGYSRPQKVTLEHARGAEHRGVAVH